MDSITLFFLLQLERIKRAGTTHAPGPKKPTLTQLELQVEKRK
jgi:hypothetical protein